MHNIPRTLVEKIREKVIEIASESDSYDSIDVEKLDSSDEMIERFILDYQVNNGQNVQEESLIVSSVKTSILDTLGWRKEIGVNKMKDSDFPNEFYQIDLFKKGKQSNGQLFLVFNTGRMQRLSTWSTVWINFIVHECEKMTEVFLAEKDFLSKPRPLVFCDSSEISFSHMDVKFILTIIPIFLKHYTQAFESIWLYELPYFSMCLRPILNASLPRKITKLVHFTDRKNLLKDLGAENVPIEYGGASIYPLESIEPVNPADLTYTGRKYGFEDNEIKKMSDSLKNKLKNIGKIDK